MDIFIFAIDFDILVAYLSSVIQTVEKNLCEILFSIWLDAGEVASASMFCEVPSIGIKGEKQLTSCVIIAGQLWKQQKIRVCSDTKANTRKPDVIYLKYVKECHASGTRMHCNNSVLQRCVICLVSIIYASRSSRALHVLFQRTQYSPLIDNTFLALPRWVLIFSHHRTIRESVVKLSKSTTTVLNGETVFPLVTICISFVRYKRQMNGFCSYAFILIRLSRVRSFKKPEFARIIVSRDLLILTMKYFCALELWMINVIHSLSVLV